MITALAVWLLPAAGCAAPSSPPAPATPTAPPWQALYDGWVWPAPIPDFALIDQAGRAFHLSDLEGYLLVGFIFTRCQVGEACPLTTTKMARTLDLWTAAAAPPPLHLLSLTLDPETDTPERLRAYAEARGLDLRRWTLATGPRALMADKLPSLFNVLALPSEEGGITHTVKVALLRPDRTQVAEWKDDAFQPQAALDALLADASAPRGE